MAKMNAINGEVTLQSPYDVTHRLGIDFSQQIPVVQIIEKSTSRVMFDIYYRGSGLVSQSPLTALNGQYSVVTLSGSQYGVFNNGYCLAKQTSSCVVYLSLNGDIYTPMPNAITLQ